MNQRNRIAAALAVTSTLALASSGALAAGGVWDTGLGPGSGNGATSATPWISAPAAGSKYAEWNFFTDDNGLTALIVDNTPDIANVNLGGTATVTETTNASFLTSGGNIYSPSVPTAFTLSMPGGVGSAFEVWLRASTIGSLLSTTATLNGVAATAVESFGQTVIGGFGGDEKEWYWKWNVAAAPTYSFAFNAASSSVSLDQLAVYAAPVPEPSTYAMLALGLAGLAVARARRSRG